ncbi:hypothetical protein DP939_43025 [Spongiactinospora rosea]|uniref:Uncharacterized protein n=1 Tax=Spongiactinospora rosea TaxID=2248750 RepID=A0A366LKI3_9ACTN|nr:hypothetical protein DP939_43025 [Spongiactinospora rosea]
MTADDWMDIRKLARGYCRTVDATRPRKRMDGSATVVQAGYAPYGTDDVSDDVTQDAALMFAQRLRDITASYRPADEATPTEGAWIYVRRDGGQMVITRTTLKRWAVRDAAARNGYRADVAPERPESAPGDHATSARPDAGSAAQVAVATSAAQNSEAIFRTAFGDGSEFPIITNTLKMASQADDLGRAGFLNSLAQQMHGGAYGSRYNVIRARNAGRAEWRELSERLDEARNTLVYGGTEPASD